MTSAKDFTSAIDEDDEEEGGSANHQYDGASGNKPICQKQSWQSERAIGCLDISDSLSIRLITFEFGGHH